MIIELASGRKQKYVSVESYKRKRNVSAHTRKYPNLRENKSAHIYIPAHLNNGSGVFVREDHLDCLNDNDWDTLMDSVLDFQPSLNELSGKAKRQEKRAAKSEKKQSRQTRKSDKNTRKNDKVDGKNSRKQTKADAKKLKGQAKVDKANNPNRKDASEIFDNVIDKASNVYNKFKGGKEDSDNDTQGAKDPSGSDGSDSNDDGKIFGLPKMVVYGGGTVIALSLIALVVSKNKKVA